MDPITAIASLASSVITRLWPDKTEVDKEAFLLEFQKVVTASQLLTKQIDVDQAEAASTSMFVAGWRPMVGWVCALAFAWQFLILPMGCFLAVICHQPQVATQMQSLHLDYATMSSVLMGMLGLGGMRTYEKMQNVQNNH